MATEKKVVDSSIIAKWFLNELDSAKALELRDNHVSGKIILIAPELAFIEVMNVLRYKNYSTAELSKANSALWDMQLHVEKLNLFLLDKAINVAIKYDLSLYDAIYAVLASIFGVPLVTADKELQKLPNVVML